jgi:predicted enzyme related to lactoylglutathione lyase
MTITHLAVAPVYVTDQQRALEFYRDGLGFEVCTDNAFGDQRWIEVAPSGAATRLSLMLPGSVPYAAQVAAGPGYAFSSPDVERTHAALVAAGVTITSEPTVEPWGSWFGFRDPDDNAFIVSQSSDGVA